MPILQITWESRGQIASPLNLVEKLNHISEGRCIQALANTWFIDTDKTAAETWAAVAFTIHDADSIIVTEVSDVGGHANTGAEADLVRFRLGLNPGR